MDWYTPATAQASDIWADVHDVSVDTLQLLLDVARDQVTAYAPTLAPETPVPAAYAFAQLRQAQNLYRAATADASGNIGEETFAITPHPLDWHIKSLLRPHKGRPRVR